MFNVVNSLKWTSSRGYVANRALKSGRSIIGRATFAKALEASVEYYDSRPWIDLPDDGSVYQFAWCSGYDYGMWIEFENTKGSPAVENNAYEEGIQASADYYFGAKKNRYWVPYDGKSQFDFYSTDGLAESAITLFSTNAETDAQYIVSDDAACETRETNPEPPGESGFYRNEVNCHVNGLHCVLKFDGPNGREFRGQDW